MEGNEGVTVALGAGHGTRRGLDDDGGGGCGGEAAHAPHAHVGDGCSVSGRVVSGDAPGNSQGEGDTTLRRALLIGCPWAISP